MKKIRKYIPYFVKQILINLLSIIEKILIKYYSKQKLLYPPIFIIWAPRTWSTILYQYITKYIDISYPNNFVWNLPEIPLFASLFYKFFFKKKKHNSFSSNYWETKWYSSPNEFGWFFYRWLSSKKDYYTSKELNSKKKNEIKSTIIWLQHINKKAYIIKNMNCWLRISLIKDIFPEAIFIFCKRDPLETAHSILNVRKKICNNPNSWWSIKPKEFDNIRNLDYYEQIVKQIYYIEKQIHFDLKELWNNKYLIINYNNFLDNPQYILKQINKLLNKNNINLKINGNIIKKNLKNRNKEYNINDNNKFSKYISKLNWNTYEKIH
jgi:hypothetical protein